MLSFPQVLISQARERVPQLLSPRVTISGNALTDTPNRVPPLPNLGKLAILAITGLSGANWRLPLPIYLPWVSGPLCEGNTVTAPCEPQSARPNPAAATSKIRTVHPRAQA